VRQIKAIDPNWHTLGQAPTPVLTTRQYKVVDPNWQTLGPAPTPVLSPKELRSTPFIDTLAPVTVGSEWRKAVLDAAKVHNFSDLTALNPAPSATISAGNTITIPCGDRIPDRAHVALDGSFSSTPGLIDARTRLYNNGTNVYKDGNQQNGWTVTKTANAIQGYDYVLTGPGGLLPLGVNTMRVYLEGVRTFDTTYTFTAADLDAPYIANLDPFNGETNVPLDKVISFDLLDDVAGVDSVTVKIYLLGSLIWENDANIGGSGYTVVKTSLAKGFHYTVTPTGSLPPNTTVTMRITADDLAAPPNSLDTAISSPWSFGTELGNAQILNPSFEIIGATDGVAENWAYTHSDGQHEYAPVESSLAPREAFEGGWDGGNQYSRDSFEDDDLQAADFQQPAESTSEPRSGVETFDWGWKRPILTGKLTLTFPGGGSDANNAFTTGSLIRDRTTGGLARVLKQEGTADVWFTSVNYHTGINTFGVADDILMGADFVKYTFENESNLKWIGFQLPEISAGRIIHYDYTTLTVTKADGSTFDMSPDENGLLTHTELDTDIGNSTINMSDGEVRLYFKEAPTKILFDYEKGAILTGASTDGPPYALPYILASWTETLIPPWNHSSEEHFDDEDLEAAEIGGGTDPEAFEVDWLSPGTTSSDFNDDSIDELTSSDLDVAEFDVAAGGTEDFENEWTDNETSLSAFSGSDLDASTFDTAGTAEAFEDFEELWTTNLQI
jgi:hypothetical protein